MEQPDPDCAICRAPASAACECESKGLDMAIKQAEQRIMQSIYHQIRSVLCPPTMSVILLVTAPSV